MSKPFDSFSLVSLLERDGFQLDSFLGTIVRRAYRIECATGPFGTPSYPPQDSEYREWVDLLEAVLEARECFTMIELGAGFGRWTARGAFAAKQRGIPYRLIAVEPDPTHFLWLEQHLKDNAISASWLMRTAVTDTRETVQFSKQNPAESYGQCIIRHADVETIVVPAFTLSDILARFRDPWYSFPDYVDLIDMDIQGEEARVVLSSVSDLNAKVKRLHIGTHTRGIEQKIRECLISNGWTCLADEPCGLQDGAQSWVNPRLQSANGQMAQAHREP